MADYINFVNGVWQPASESLVSFKDGGFQRGDGLFETIRFHHGKLFKAEKHLNRLQSGLNIIQIKLNKSKSDLISLLEEMVERNDLSLGLLRIMVTRGEVEGTPWNYQGSPNFYITIRPLTEKPEEPVKVVFYSEEKYPIIRFNPAIKSLNYIGNMLAKKDADKEGAFEPVFYNQEKIITECAIRNIFFIKNKILLTPTIDLGVLPGIMRETIMDIAPELGLMVSEESIPLVSINNMDEAFISSTGIGLLSCYWEGWNSEFSYTSKLKGKLDLLINSL